MTVAEPYFPRAQPIPTDRFPHAVVRRRYIFCPKYLQVLTYKLICKKENHMLLYKYSEDKEVSHIGELNKDHPLIRFQYFRDC